MSGSAAAVRPSAADHGTTLQPGGAARAGGPDQHHQERRRTGSAARITLRDRLSQPATLRAELLLNLAVLGTAALLIVVINLLLFEELIATRHGGTYIVLLILADVAVFVLFGAVKLRKLVARPLEQVVEAAQAIAAGDLSRRVPPGQNAEFVTLAKAINHMTVRLLEQQAHVARIEKLAGVGRLATGVAHEIGNPLGAIHGYTHMLRRNAAVVSAARDALDGLDRETERIDRIMRGMLEYARPRLRTQVAVDVNASIHRVIGMLSDQGTLRNVKVNLALAPSLPWLSGDRHEMDQVFVNLLLNAVDAMKGNGTVFIMTRHVPFAEFAKGEKVRRESDPPDLYQDRDPNGRLRAWLNVSGEPEEVLQILVADSGPGVPPGESERIFDPFYTTKDPGYGTGMGLAIVSRIVESMDGAVWVRRAREGGAAFAMLFAVSPSLDNDDVR